jgi:hypothetical protein
MAEHQVMSLFNKSQQLLVRLRVATPTDPDERH